MTMQNSFIAGNTHSDSPDCAGSISSTGYNIIGNTAGCSFDATTGDLLNVDPKVLPLTGSPGYHPLQADSRAIDAGNPAGCTDNLGNPLTMDQRGAAREGRCDIGAYEYTTPGPAASITALDGTHQSASLFTPFQEPLQALVLDNIGSPVNNATVTFSGPESGAGGIFADSGTFTTTAVSGESGITTATTFTANGIAGNYIVSATVSGVAAPANFLLTNLSQIFLPDILRNYCPDFFDDFSNPSSGWPVGEDDFVRAEYLDGEYRILSKQGGFLYFFRAPTCDRENFVIEVDTRWVGTPGNSYGLLFGITGNFDQLYLFDSNTDLQMFRLLRLDDSGFSTIVEPTYSSAINGGTASNHLKVTRNGNQITLKVNETVLGTWTDSTITGLTSVGIVSSSYVDQPASDARFDNFSATSLPSNSRAATYQMNNMASRADPLSRPETDYIVMPADRDW